MFNIFAACDDRNGIGKDGMIPWSSSKVGREDLAEFRRQTLNGVVIMGRKTYESIGRPLCERTNIVVSRNREYLDSLKDGYTVIYTASSFEEALAIARERIEENAKMMGDNYKLNGKISVIGGAELYAEALRHPRLGRLYISRIPGDFECDVFMPRFEVPQIGGYSFGSDDIDVEIYGSYDEDKYLHLLNRLLTAPLRPNRTGVPTRGLFAEKLEFSLMRGSECIIPLLTTKRVPARLVIAELLWFLSGDCTDTSFLQEHNCHIWDDNTTREFLDSRGLTNYAPGECGPIYGYQWRHWGRPYVPIAERNRRKSSIEIAASHGTVSELKTAEKEYKILDYSIVKESKTNNGIDQLAAVIKTLRTDPFDRRMIVSAWNPEQLSAMALPPCHWSFQFHCETVRPALRCKRETPDCKRETPDCKQGTPDCKQNDAPQPKYILNCLLNMRSADVALGVPFNIASYALLTHMVAKCVNMLPGRLVIMMADCHIYTNHIDGANEQIGRTPGQFPTLSFREDIIAGGDIDQFTSVDQIIVGNYQPHPTIKYPMAL
jgi:thymidylate synthase/dihydrofolate reductase